MKTPNEQATTFQQTTITVTPNAASTHQTQVLPSPRPLCSGYSLPPPTFYTPSGMVGTSLPSLLQQTTFLPLTYPHQLPILLVTPSNVSYVPPPSWQIVNGLMKQVKHLAEENEKREKEMDYLRETLSLSQYLHTIIEDNRGSVRIQPITPFKNRQAVAPKGVSPIIIKD